MSASGGGTYDVLFCVAAVILASTFGTLSTLIGHRYKSWSDVLAIGALSGAVALATIGFYVGDDNTVAGMEYQIIGIASVIGVLGKQALRIVYFLADAGLKKIGVDTEGIWDESTQQQVNIDELESNDDRRRDSNDHVDDDVCSHDDSDR